jgi:hypothetical protein
MNTLRIAWILASTLVLVVTGGCGAKAIETPGPCGVLPDAGATDAAMAEADVSPGPPELDAAPERDASDREEASTADAALDAADAWTSDAELDGGSFGNPQMSCAFTVIAPGNQRINAVAVSSTGVIGIAGYTAADLNLGDGTISVPDGGKFVGFVAELDTWCRIQWSRPFGESASALAFDSTGNLWVAGGKSDEYLEIGKFDDTGNLLYDVRYPATGYVAPSAIATDAADSCLVAGTLRGGAITVGNNTISFAANDASAFVDQGVLLFKVKSSGVVAWAKGFGGEVPFAGSKSCYRSVFGLAIDSSGDVLVGGSYDCDLSLGGPALPAPSDLSWPAVGDGFVGRLRGADGSHVWSRALPGVDVRGIGLTPGSELLFTGALSTAQDFGSGLISPIAQYAGAQTGYIAGMPSNGGPSIWGRIVAVPDSPLLYSATARYGSLPCGGSLGERCLLTGEFTPIFPRSTYFLQAVNGRGDVEWNFDLPYPAAMFAVAAGVDREVVWGGLNLEPTHYGATDEDYDVYLARFVRW